VAAKAAATKVFEEDQVAEKMVAKERAERAVAILERASVFNYRTK
jgi:hypothetical protein